MLAQSCGRRFEAGLQQVRDRRQAPRSEKSHDKLLERLGRRKPKSRGAGQHGQIGLVTEETGKTVTAISWQRVPVPRQDDRASRRPLPGHQRTRRG